MESITLHIEALKIVFAEFKAGRHLKFFIPGIMIALLFGSVFSLTNGAEGLLSFIEKVPLIGGILSGLLTKTFGVIYFLVLQIYVFFILTLLSPFNTLLSESVDSSLTGTSYSFSILQVLTDLARMVFVVLVSITLELIFIGGYWILSWILGLGFMDKLAFTLISAFFFGLSFYDYSLERYRKGVFATFGFAFSHILLVTLTGLFFLLIFAIPYLGIPISPVLATMLATVIYVKKYRKEL
jgi:uncharacterized protein involved in cysteine biosynthesis